MADDPRPPDHATRIRDYLHRKYRLGRTRKDATCRRCGRPFSQHRIYFEGAPQPSDFPADFGVQINGVFCPKERGHDGR